MKMTLSYWQEKCRSLPVGCDEWNDINGECPSTAGEILGLDRSTIYAYAHRGYLDLIKIVDEKDRGLMTLITHNSIQECITRKKRAEAVQMKRAVSKSVKKKVKKYEEQVEMDLQKQSRKKRA